MRHDLGVDRGLAHAAGDELSVLGAEIDDQDGPDGLVRGRGALGEGGHRPSITGGPPGPGDGLGSGPGPTGGAHEHDAARIVPPTTAAA